MAIAMVEARRRAADNRVRLDQLRELHAALVARCADEELRQDVNRARVHNVLLVPFARALSRLKDVRLAELDDFEMPGVGALSAIDLACRLDDTLRAGRTVLGGAGSAAGVGAGMGAATWAVAGLLGAASTGIPIAGLSGVAASNATLAFLGGGSLATGGGGMALGTAVLGGVVTVPALVLGAGVVTALGRRDLRGQCEAGDRLNESWVAFLQDRHRLDQVLQRAQHVRGVLGELLDAGRAGLLAVTATIEENEDPRTWIRSDRARVAAIVRLVVVITALMQAPLADESGAVANLDGGALADARHWLIDYYDGEVR